MDWTVAPTATGVRPVTQGIHISLSSTGDINAHNLQWWHFQIKMLCFQKYVNIIVSPGKKKNLCVIPLSHFSIDELKPDFD